MQYCNALLFKSKFAQHCSWGTYQIWLYECVYCKALRKKEKKSTNGSYVLHSFEPMWHLSLRNKTNLANMFQGTITELNTRVKLMWALADGKITSKNVFNFCVFWHKAITWLQKPWNTVLKSHGLLLWGYLIAVEKYCIKTEFYSLKLKIGLKITECSNFGANYFLNTVFTSLPLRLICKWPLL